MSLTWKEYFRKIEKRKKKKEILPFLHLLSTAALNFCLENFDQIDR